MLDGAAPIRVLVVDDESSARRRLLQFLAGESDVVVVGESSDGNMACRAIEQLAPDLVFLDVEMPELSGLDVVARIGIERMPATIFATAYGHYAVSAFDANAMDYLLKPFDQPRFARAMAKARARLRNKAGAETRQAPASVLDQLGSARSGSERILVRDGESQQLIKLSDILYIAADGNYVRLHTAAERFLLRQTLTAMMARLDRAQFRRIHRSHIVNLDYVSKILPWFGGDSLVMMANGCRLTLSRTYREALADFS